jgi:serine/threonine protein kinase
MAPEVVAQSPYKENVDIWSLAITMIEMTDRVPPLYYLENSEDIYNDILSGDSPRFQFSIPSKGLSDLVRWMLTHNGSTRPGAKAVLKVKITKISRVKKKLFTHITIYLENSRGYQKGYT